MILVIYIIMKRQVINTLRNACSSSLHRDKKMHIAHWWSPTDTWKQYRASIIMLLYKYFSNISIWTLMGSLSLTVGKFKKQIFLQKLIFVLILHYIASYRVGQKRGILLLSIFLPIINQFSKFFHWHTLRTIYNNVIITYPTTP